MSAYLAPTSLILVGVITEPRDLEIARLLGWYRIPMRFAPKVLGVDYLAFYQTKNFGEQDRWQIVYYAPVRGYELTTRAELLREEKDHPRAHEEYYKISLGPLEALNEPIRSGAWRRITFLYTTGSYLSHAKNVQDLVVRDEERDVLWRSLRERAMQSGVYTTEPVPDDFLDAAFLAMLGDTNRLAETPEPYDV